MAWCCPECMMYRRPTKEHATEAHCKLYLISNTWTGKASGRTSETISLKFHLLHQELRDVHPKTKGNNDIIIIIIIIIYLTANGLLPGGRGYYACT
jgi:hypothetical protein